MKLQFSSNNIMRFLRYLAVYLLLLSSAGFHIYAQGYHIGMMLLSAFVCFAFSQKRIDTRVLISFLVMLVIVITSGLINDEKIRNIILPVIDILCAVLIAFSALGDEQKGEIVEIFRRTMLVIAVGSVILFALGWVVNSWFSFLPMFSQGNHDAYFAGVTFVYRIRQYLQYRNLGIFWEPGAFQTFLLLTMILEDAIDGKHKLRNLLFITVAILTTVSTTGIICLMLFWIVYIAKSENRQISLLITVILLLGVFIVVAYPEILPEQLHFGIVDKISDFLSGDQELQTVQTRMDSVVYPLQAFWQNPLFGVSKSGMSAWRNLTGHAMNTCTPINWFAHYGCFMGIILMVGFGKFFAKISKKRWVGFALFLIFLLSISTEAFNYCPTILCFAFMGISTQKDLLPGGKTDENTSG